MDLALSREVNLQGQRKRAIYAVVCFLSVFFYLLPRTEKKSLNVLLSNIWYFLVAFIMDFLFLWVPLVRCFNVTHPVYSIGHWSYLKRFEYCPDFLFQS